MIRVRFFARIREQVACSELELPLSGATADLDALSRALCERGAAWREALTMENLIRAVNQVVVEGNRQLMDGDEIAFYPPVTGG